ncbi:MAG TPA: hypothetical protein VI233_05490 [Puia sp.]
MKGMPVRTSNILSLPRALRDLPYNKSRIADSLGLFALLVLILGLLALLDAAYLQTVAFFALGTGQLVFLQKKLRSLLKSRDVTLFSREGWSYIGVLGVLLLLTLTILYLVIEGHHWPMIGPSLLAFLLPFIALNGWELWQKKNSELAGWLAGAVLLILLTLVFLPGMQQSRPPSNTYVSAATPAADNTDKTPAFERASALLNDASTRLMTLDANLTRLTDTAAIDSARKRIKAQEYALGKLLDSLDGPSHELGPLAPAFRSLLSGHRIMSNAGAPASGSPAPVSATPAP